MKIDFPSLFLLDNDLSIRRLSVDDLSIINRWHNSNELYKYLVGSCYRPSLETDRKWFYDGLNNDRLYRGIIIYSTEPIGVVYLTRDNVDSIVFEIFIANEAFRGQGIGTIVCSSIIKKIFSYSEYNQIVLSVLKSNNRAIALYKKSGFKIVSSKKVLKDNKPIYVYNMCITRRDYENKRD